MNGGVNLSNVPPGLSKLSQAGVRRYPGFLGESAGAIMYKQALAAAWERERKAEVALFMDRGSRPRWLFRRSLL